MRKQKSKIRQLGMCDYIRSGNVLIPVCLLSHDDYMRFVDEYANDGVDLVTLK